MTLENRVDAQLSSSAARFFFFRGCDISAFTWNRCLRPPNSPPQELVTSLMPLSRAQLSAPLVRHAHTDGFQKGGWGCTKTKQPQQTLRQRSRSPRCSQMLCWKPAPVVLVDRSFQKATFSPHHPSALFFRSVGSVTCGGSRGKGFFFFFTESRDSSAVEFETRVACLFMALLKWIKKRQNSY